MRTLIVEKQSKFNNQKQSKEQCQASAAAESAICAIQKSIGTSNAAAWKQAVTGMFPKFLVSIALELANGSVLLAACCLSLFLLPAAVIIHVHNKAQIVVKESQVPKYPAACYQAAAGMLNKSFSVCQSYTLFDTVCCCCLFALLLQHGQLGNSRYMQTPKKRSKMAA